MDPASHGNTLLIVNPVAQSGRARVVCGEVLHALEASAQVERVALRETRAANHAVSIAEESAGFDTVVALGGDGLAHEVTNGLMRVPEQDRPAFALVPCGSGNGFARTLGMSTDITRAIDQLFAAERDRFDVGVCNGEYFCETLSFGLDAAIALDTVERRRKSGRSGFALYAASGVDQLLHHRDIRHLTYRKDGGEPRSVDLYLLAVQIGCSYGGGFMIAPDADPTDGIFDTCIARAPLSLARAAYTFARAKNGNHRGLKNVESGRAKTLELSFAEPVPTQIDGEKMESLEYSISCVPRALPVLRCAER